MRTAYRSSHFFKLPGIMAVRWEPPANTYGKQVKGGLHVQIIANGKAQEISAGCTVYQLLQYQAVTLKAAVVELNEKILKQEHWQSTLLQAGDRLEILVFMGGG